MSSTTTLSIAMANFDVVTYLASLVTYPLPKDSIQRIAVEREVISVKDWTEIDRRKRNLCLADILMLMFTAPNDTGNRSKTHNNFTVSIGGIKIYNKAQIYDLMMKLYENPDQEIWEALKEGTCSFIDII